MNKISLTELKRQLIEKIENGDWEVDNYGQIVIESGLYIHSNGEYYNQSENLYPEC